MNETGNEAGNDTGKTEQHELASRRGFLKKAAYVAPAVMTLNVVPSIAAAGSGLAGCNNGIGNGDDCTPPGDPFDNDQDPSANPSTGPNATWKDTTQ